jgi:broad specificity phosphatase PhoE
MKKIVIFVRHGESVKNRDRIFTSEEEGWPLTENGREQADFAGRELSGIGNIDRLYVSPVLRARETAQIISKYINTKPAVITALLKERYAGKYENYNYKDRQEIIDILDEQIKTNYPQWESWKSLIDKIGKFDAMLKDGEVNLAVSHGGNVKAAIGYVLGIQNEADMQDVEKLGILSASITVIDFAKRGPDSILAQPGRILPKGFKL